MATHPTRSHLHVLPVTRTGWSSLAMTGLSVLCWLVFAWLVGAGHGGPDPLLLVAMAGFFGFAFGGAVAGVVDLVRSRERAPLLVLPIVYGLLWTAFLAGEFVNPH